MLGSSPVAAQLAASQEGLSSMSDDDDRIKEDEMMGHVARMKEIKNSQEI
jgi:hypothetical protein